MSSMRNAVQRRNHKERAQPTERSKWGLLEKHKDYTLRARDHNEKKRKVKALRQKVAERNPDEFAFGMMSSTTKGGIKIAQRGKDNGTTGPLSMDVAKLLKTQDSGYLQMVLQQTRLEKERVAQEVVLANVDVNGNDEVLGRHRTRFDDDGSEIPSVNMEDIDELDDVLGDTLGDVLDDEMDDGQDTEEKSEDISALTPEQIQRRRKRKHVRKVLERKLEALRGRERDLSRALDRLENQRAKMSNSVGGVNKNGTKFKIRERKR